MTLQSCILDNQSSLDDIVQGIDKVFQDDPIFVHVKHFPDFCLRSQHVLAEARN